MPRIAYTMILSIAAIAALPAGANEAADKKLSAAVDRALAAQGPIVTAEDRALIARKCGYSAEEAKGERVHINNDVLICANGKRVAADDETRAMSERISTRANRHAERALKSAEVALATAEVKREATERALKEVRRSLKEARP